MNSTTHKITLDIHKTGSQLFMSMIRGDNKRSIIISLTESGKPYTITEGCTAEFTAVKPDGHFIYNPCRVDFEQNVIVYDVTEQTTAVSGAVNCQIKLIGNDGGILTSPTFGIIVGDTLYNEEPIVESSEEFHALTAYVADLQKKLADGEFKGDKGDKGDAGISVTHEWNGTVLKVTSASGTSSSDLKGQKGDKGDKGDRGVDADATKFASAVVGYSGGSTIQITDSANVAPRCLSVYGKSTQDGTPTPNTPVDIVSIGADGDILVSVNEQTAVVSTPNGLHGIPVTGTAIATYTDDNGKMWCADEIDFERGVYIQRAIKWTPSLSNVSGYYEIGKYARGSVFISSKQSISTPNGLCNIASMVGNYTLDELHFYAQNAQLWFFAPISELEERSAKGVVKWFVDQNAEFYYILATPIETPLTEDEIAQYKLLKMNYPNTTITNDENAYMDVEYVVDTKMFINKSAGGAVGSVSTISSVDLPAKGWVGTKSPYSQVVNISGATENSKIDLNPSVEQLAIFHDKDIAFVTENDDGIITVYCIGQKPTIDYSMQVTITEVATNG